MTDIGQYLSAERQDGRRIDERQQAVPEIPQRLRDIVGRMIQFGVNSPEFGIVRLMHHLKEQYFLRRKVVVDRRL